ncbi:hypothetical protein ACNQ17_00535 [Mycoplasma sp. Sp48II]|uniref:hypothetical protein n=1 Tax=unclassified Mycoplasma TaxID=2683645 RepID=UPI003AAFA5EC
MKKIHKILLGVGSVITPVLPLIAVSCNNELTPEQRADKLLTGKNINVNLVSGLAEPIEINYKGAEFVVNKKTGRLTSKKELSTNGKSIFNAQIKNAISEIKKAIQEKIKIEYVAPAEGPAKDFLIKPANSFHNIPKFFRVVIKQEHGQTINLLYVFSSLSQSFGNWTDGLKLGINGPKTDEEHAKALKLTEMDSINAAVYNAYSEDNILINDLEVRIPKDIKTQINPTFEDFNANMTTPNPKIFQNVNINWNKFPVDNYFDGKIVSIADGDTFSVQLFNEKDTIEGTFYPGGPVFEKAEGQDKPKRNRYHEPKIRLGGIDTPEKAVDKTMSPPFEYAFALMPTNFATKLWSMTDPETGKPFGANIRVAFLSFDAYERVVADVFFGKDYKYSYNCEIVRAGLTLPYSNTFRNENGVGIHNVKNSYEDLVLEQVAIAMHQAQDAHRGFFHYFENTNQISDFIYMAKKNTEGKKFENIYKNYINNQKNK